MLLNVKDPDLVRINEIYLDSLLDIISGRGKCKHFEIEDTNERENLCYSLSLILSSQRLDGDNYVNVHNSASV